MAFLILGDNMNNYKARFPIYLFFIMVIITSGMLIKYNYDTYNMQLNGTIDAVRTDIKQAMYITVANQEQNLSHFWPKLQRNVEVGDSVIKASKNTVIVLIKKKSKLRYTCTFEE